MTKQDLALYLHIPFCKTMCSYCAFNTYTELDDLIPAFVAALANEIRIVAAANPQLPLKTIYFGGGTPSLLSPQDYHTLFRVLRDHFTLVESPEITLEANPNDLSLDYLRELREIGFNRLSIGMQSANPEVLQLFNRRHDTAMTIQAVDFARQAGFDNLSLDLIFAAPNETLDSWQKTVQQALDLKPEHLSHYELMFKGGTELTKQVKAGKLAVPDEDLAADMYDCATDMLKSAGYEQYEISNWSKPQRESQHNLQYWRNLQYLGLGPGAHGFAGGVRYIVLRHPQKYIEKLQTPLKAYKFPRTPAISKATIVDKDTDRSETLMMGLRLTKEGIQRAAFQARFGQDILEIFAPTIERFVNLGLLHIDETCLRLTEKGRLISNPIISEFI